MLTSQQPANDNASPTDAQVTATLLEICEIFERYLSEDAMSARPTSEDGE